MKKITEKQFKRTSWVVLILTIVVTAFFTYNIKDIQLNYDFEEFFPAEDSETNYFFSHRERFESDNDFVIIAIERANGIFDSLFLNQVHQFSQEIESLELVKYTRDITKEDEPFIYPGGVFGTRPYVNLSDIDLKRDSAFIYKNRELINTLVAKRGKALSIYVRHDDFLSKAKSSQLVDELHEISKNYDFENVRFAGRTIGQTYYVETMTNEMIVYVGYSMILVIIFLLLAFRSVWGLLVPQVVIISSMLWIVGFMAWVGEPLNILLTILPSIMFVVAMSDVIHLVSKYLELLREGKDKFSAIKTAFKEIGMATFLTSLTTSIGFFSLVFVNVIPIKVFGIYVGIGVLMTFLLTYSTLPFLFFHTKTPVVSKQKKTNFWLPYMRKAFLFTMRNRKMISWFSLAVITLFSFGATLIVSDNYLMDDLNHEVQLKQDFNYFDREFGGVRPFELAVNVVDSTKNVWDINLLREIEKVEDYLVSTYGVNIKSSLVQFLSILNRASHAGDTDYFKLPSKKSKLRQFKRIIKISDEGKFIRSIVDSSERILRISGTIPDWGNIETTKRNNDLALFLSDSIDKKELEFTPTGSAHLLDKNMSYLSSSLIQGLLFATIVVALIMGIIYQSIRMIFISIVPNLIPLIIIAGIMGFFGIHLKITTAIVFTISFGIAVDDTIHFLSKFKLELNKGNSKLYALKRTYLSTGKAIVLTSAVLSSGFLLLLLSDFLGTFYMGFMISITLIFAVIVDLFLLPLLLLYFYHPKGIKRN